MNEDFQVELIREARKHIQPLHISDRYGHMQAWLAGALYVQKRYGSDPDAIQAKLLAVEEAREKAESEAKALRSALEDLARDNRTERESSSPASSFK